MGNANKIDYLTDCSAKHREYELSYRQAQISFTVAKDHEGMVRENFEDTWLKVTGDQTYCELSSRIRRKIYTKAFRTHYIDSTIFSDSLATKDTREPSDVRIKDSI